MAVDWNFPLLKKSLLLVPVFLVVASSASPEIVERRSNGQCLSFDDREVEVVAGSSVRAGSPLFTMPERYFSLEESHGKSGALSVRYRKKTENHRKSVVERFLRPQENACERFVYKYGLAQLRVPEKQNTGSTNALGCLVTPAHDKFVPAAQDSDFATVRLTCSPNNLVKKCSIRTILPNGWEARVSFPKSQFSQWQVISKAGQNFFDDYLRDCSEK